MNNTQGSQGFLWMQPPKDAFQRSQKVISFDLDVTPSKVELQNHLDNAEAQRNYDATVLGLLDGLRAK